MKRLLKVVSGQAMIGLMATALGGAAPKPSKLESAAPTGSFIRVDPIKIADKDRDRMFLLFSRCLVKTAAPKVDQYLRRSDFSSFDSGIGDPSIFLPVEDCLGNSAIGFETVQASFSHRVMRSWLAEQVYLKEHKSFNALPVDIPAPPSRAYFSSNADLLVASRVGEFSDCLVANDSAGADALLRTERGSPAERSAAMSLAPALGACVVAGYNMKFSPAAVRAYAADGLWQRYEAAKPATFKVRR